MSDGRGQTHMQLSVTQVLCWWYKCGAMGTQRRALLILLRSERWHVDWCEGSLLRELETGLSCSRHAQALLNAGGKGNKTKYSSLTGLQSTEIMKQNT